MNINRIKKRITIWLNAKLFNEVIIIEEKVNNPFKSNGFKTIYPIDYKPFTQWSEEDRLELYKQFKQIQG